MGNGTVKFEISPFISRYKRKEHTYQYEYYP